jgi:hypothetical protein
MSSELNMMITDTAMEDGTVMNNSSIVIMDGPTVALPPQISPMRALFPWAIVNV